MCILSKPLRLLQIVGVCSFLSSFFSFLLSFFSGRVGGEASFSCFPQPLLFRYCPLIVAISLCVPLSIIRIVAGCQAHTAPILCAHAIMHPVP